MDNYNIFWFLIDPFLFFLCLVLVILVMLLGVVLAVRSMFPQNVRRKDERSV